MSGIFATLRPHFLSIKNSWFHGTALSIDRAVRLGFLITLAILIPYGIFLGVKESVSEFVSTPGAVRYVIELIHFTLLSILFFSSSIHSLQALFFSNDADLLLAAPLKPIRLFTGKFTETIIASSWAMIFFYLPTIIGIGSAFKVSGFFYCFSLLTLFPLVVIPVSLGFIASILFARMYPARRVKELFIGASLIFIVLLHFTVQGHEILLSTLQTDLPNLLAKDPKALAGKFEPQSSLSILSIPYDAALQGELSLSLIITLILYSSAIFCILAAYRTFSDLYIKIYSADTLARNVKTHKTRRNRIRIESNSIDRAIRFKDYKLFFRDIAQPIQLLLFMLMAFIAILGLKASANIGVTFRDTQRWWNDLVLLFNLSLHTLISVLFCARFIYPSVALEGEAGWIFKAAPLSTHLLLASKLRAYMFPSIGILLSLLIAGCLMSGLQWGYVVIAAIAGTLNIYAIAGIAIGSGAYFANRRYEHMGQITAGLGSFLFMLITLIVVPCLGILSLAGGIAISIIVGIKNAWFISSCSLILLTVLNLKTTRYFLQIGEKQLSKE